MTHDDSRDSNTRSYNIVGEIFGSERRTFLAIKDLAIWSFMQHEFQFQQSARQKPFCDVKLDPILQLATEKLFDERIR